MSRARLGAGSLPFVATIIIFILDFVYVLGSNRR